MSLINTIRSDQIQARKERKTAEALLLTTLLGEATRIGKDDGNRETTDDEVVAVVKKLMKGNDEIMSLVDPSSDGFLTARTENAFVSQYLPQQLTEQELIVAIKTIIQTNNLSTPKDMGVVMGGLKKSFAGRYDGKVANSLTLELLT